MEFDKKKLVILIIVGLLMIIVFIINVISIKEDEEQRMSNRGKIRVGMSQQEKDIYNASVKPYINDGIKGYEVKNMIDAIISKNISNIGEHGIFIGLLTEGNIKNYNNSDSLAEKCKKASIYDDNDGSTIVDGENNETNVQNATEEMKVLKEAINSQKKYDIKAKMSEGIYTWIVISESESN